MTNDYIQRDKKPNSCYTQTMLIDELQAYARKTAYILTREVFETSDIFAKTRDGTFNYVPPLIQTTLAPTIGDALNLYLATDHGCKSGRQILKRKILKKLLWNRTFGQQRVQVLKAIEPFLEELYKIPTDRLLFTAPFHGEPIDNTIIEQYNNLLNAHIDESGSAVIMLADAETNKIFLKTRIKEKYQCNLGFFDYLYPLIILLGQRDSLILSINFEQYELLEDTGLSVAKPNRLLEIVEPHELNMTVSVDLSDYITHRLVTTPKNPREAIEQAAITCTRRIIKKYGTLREVHFTENMFEENDCIETLLRDPIPDGDNRVIQLKAKILRDFPGSDDFVNAVEKLTLNEFASMFIGLDLWRNNRGRIF